MERHHQPKNYSTTTNFASDYAHNRDVFYDLQNIDIFLSKKKILQGINLNINKGDFVFLTGHTGAGKTTLLNFLSGEISSYSGNMISSVLEPASEIFISRIFQDLKLFNELSVLENLSFCYDSKIYRNKELYQQDLQEYIRILGLKDYQNYPLHKISGGLRQKVAILRSLLAKPEILLADEPSSNLDRASTLQLFEVLNYLNIKRKMTIVWATHNLELIKQFHGKLITLEKGRIAYSGQA